MPAAHVIDDDGVHREVVRRILEEAGWTVTESVDGREAVAHVAAAKPDVVLLDVTMPGPDGWTVLERLRSSLGAIPVVMLTSRSAHTDVIRSRQAGADDFVAKPIAGARLLERLDALLRRPPGERGLLL